MAIQMLTARQVQTAKKTLNDGGNLFLSIKVNKAGVNCASWVYRYTSPAGVDRSMGLGPVERSTLASAGESLALAREKHAKYRALRGRDIDPIEHRDAERAVAKAKKAASKAEEKVEAQTLARTARNYVEAGRAKGKVVVRLK